MESVSVNRKVVDFIARFPPAGEAVSEFVLALKAKNLNQRFRAWVQKKDRVN